MSFDESQKQLLWEHPTSIVYDKKLDTALRDAPIRISKKIVMEELPSSYPFDIKLLMKHVRADDLVQSATDNSCYADILNTIIRYSRSNKVLCGTTGKLLSRVYKLSKKNLRFQHDYSTQNNFLPSTTKATQDLVGKLHGLKPTNLISNLMYASHRFRSIIDKMAHSRRKLPNTMTEADKINEIGKENKVTIEELDITVIYGPKTCCITSPSGQDYWMPTSYILLIHNKLSDLLSVLFLAQYQQGICHQKDAYDLTVKVVHEMSNLAIRYKDKFSMISGCLEGMVTGEILLETEDWLNEDLLDNIHDELLDKLKYNYKNSKLRSLLLEADIPLRNELGCLSKVLGHPFVDMKAGAIKLHKRTTKEKVLTYESLTWVVNKAKETFVKNYLARHKRWPLCHITSELPARDPLMNAMLRNKDPDHPSITNKYGRVLNQDWARLELEKVMEFQQLENVIPFLKDKSISVFRSKAVKQYLDHDKEAKSKWEDTRLLLYYLLNPLKKIDHQEFLKQYTNSESLSLLADYLIIRLVPKEKEHKIEFRGFGVKTYNDRLRNLAQEKNMSKFLDLYCDEQAMTLGEIDVSKRLYAFRTILKAYSGYKVLYVNFDSSGWNNCFRDETVKPVIRETLSNIYGNDCMHRIHEAYEESLFIIPDGDVTYSWEGQQGGIDGLNQYAWVWVYINQIKYAVKDLPVKYHMLCKGDDMRLAILIHPSMLLNRDMKYWHGEIVNRVEEVAKEFGHEIKVQESYGSEKFFTFSKSASIKTIELPQGFRKIQKVYGANNAMISVLDEYVASSFSNAHSSCRCMTNTYGAYFVALTWSFWQILNSMYYTNLSDDELISLLLVPNILGGFPIIYLHNMRVRAESDLLSPFINMWIYARKSDKGLYRSLSSFLKQRSEKPKDLGRLYRDPYSINIVTPKLPIALLRSYIMPALKRKVRNEDIRDLIKVCDSTYNKKILKIMDTARPFNAKIMSTIYSATPEGILSELLKKFESGRSILDLILMRNTRSNADRQLLNVLQTEENLQKWRSNKVRGIHEPGCKNLTIAHDTVCPTQLAQAMRDSTWGFSVQGVSMPPLSHQITLYRPTDVSHITHAQQNHFTYHYNTPSFALDLSSSPHWQVSENTPFLGYTTRTGNITPQVSFQDKDPLIVKVKNLLDVLSWVNKSVTMPDGSIVESNLNELIMVILRGYTSITAEELAPFSAKRKSGTIQHHARAPRFKESIVPNILSNAYQNVVGNSDSHQTLVNSDLHFTVNFLHIMCEAIHMIQVELESSPTVTCPRYIWAVTTDCTHCNSPITEEPIIIEFSDSIPPNPKILNACRIENVSKSLIMKSYDDFQERAFKNVDDDNNPDSDLAIDCVVAEFIGHHYATHSTLQSRFTQHALTTEGRNTLVNLTHATTSRQIGFTEIKRMPLASIVRGLFPIIYDFIFNRISDYTETNLMLYLQKIHSYELPWHGLLDILHKCGRLGALITYMYRLTKIHPPACYENASPASPYIGMTIYVYNCKNNIPLNLAIRTYQSRENVQLAIDMYLNPIKVRLFHTHFVLVQKLWVPGTDNKNLMAGITRRAMYIILFNVDMEVISDRLENNWTSNQYNPVSLSDYVIFDADLMGTMMDDDDTGMGKFLVWVKSTYPSWPWNQIMDEITMGDIIQDCIVVVRNLLGTINIQIGIADISSCIQILRDSHGNIDDLTEHRYDMSSSDDDTQYVNRNHEIQHYGIPKNTPPQSCYKPKCPIVNNNFVPRNKCMENDYTYDKIILDQCHSYRLFGNGTTSMNKLDYLLTVCGISKTFPDNIHILVSADGYGGFVEYISALTKDSLFTFNTLPTRSGRNNFPYAAVDNLITSRSRVNTDMLDAGICDLSSTECMKGLMNPTYSYTVVTCDADIAWGNRDTAQAVIFNITKVYLFASICESLFVCKANLGFINIVVEVVGVLRRYCRFVTCVRCPQSNMGGEVYIVAFGLDSYPISLDDVVFTAHDHEYINLQRFSHRMLQQQEIYLRSDQSIRINPYIMKSMKQMYAKLACAVDVKLMSRLGMNLSVKDIVASSRYKEQAISIIIRKIRDMSVLHLDMLTKPNKYEMKGVAYHQGTLTHHRLIAMKYMTTQACYLTLLLSQKQDTIDKTQARMMFVSTYTNIQALVNLPHVTSQMYRRSYMITNNPIFSPYMRFVEGLRIAQMIIGYIAHSKLSTATHEDVANMFAML